MIASVIIVSVVITLSGNLFVCDHLVCLSIEREKSGHWLGRLWSNFVLLLLECTPSLQWLAVSSLLIHYLILYDSLLLLRRRLIRCFVPEDRLSFDSCCYRLICDYGWMVWLLLELRLVL
jgi:hypothetical protein